MKNPKDKRIKEWRTRKFKRECSRKETWI